jgi:drug/metabolite transporter (DMT)-like permease
MTLILLLYILMASTFTLAKTAVAYMSPIYFIGLRMSIAGLILLGYGYYKGLLGTFNKKDWWLLIQVPLFHIYCAYVLEFWSLQYITSIKACLLYNISPFITALLCYILFAQKLSYQKWLGLIIGFCGMLPILLSNSMQEKGIGAFWRFSFAEIALLVAIISSAYGWIIIKELMVNRKYNLIMLNGMGMLGGGLAALLTAPFFEGSTIIIWNNAPADRLGKMLIPLIGPLFTTLVMIAITLTLLICIANIIGYNLYGFLLKRYSPTLLSFAGFSTPFFAAIFGWFFLKEALTLAFIISFIVTFIGLYIFYRSEIADKF